MEGRYIRSEGGGGGCARGDEECFHQRNRGCCEVMSDGVPEAALDIKVVRSSLQWLVRNGFLKSSHQYGRVRGARARYFVLDSEVL